MRSVFMVIVFIGIIFLLTYTNLVRENVYVRSINSFQNSFLTNLLDMDVDINSIFFLETSSESFEHGVLEIRKRAACALESAALHHENRSVFMVYMFPDVTEGMAIEDKFLKPLLGYPNIRVVYAISSDYVKGTPVKELHAKGTVDTSPYWLTHRSDIFRAVTLLKFGGIYLDSDVVVLKPLDELGKNFIGLEIGGILASGIMGFEKEGFGHQFLKTLLTDVNKNYKPQSWSGNGPLLFTNYTYLMGTSVRMSSIKLLRNSFLKNVLEMDVEHNSIFFLETSFRTFEHGVLEINKRAACSLESAALHHQNRSVYMVYIFPNSTEEIVILDKFLKPLLSYPNVNVVYAILGDYIKGTPVESLYFKNVIDASPYWINHHSDILRMITLKRFGGIYMDSDVIVLKPFDDLGENFIALEIGDYLANGVMGFERFGFGGDFLNMLLMDVNENYNPNAWSANGPLLFSKWAKQLCNTTNLAKFANRECSSLRILSTDHFYPIYGTSWQKLFDENYNDEVFKNAKNSYLVHFWNKLSSGSRLGLDSNASYMILARENCPKVYSQLYKTF